MGTKDYAVWALYTRVHFVYSYFSYQQRGRSAPIHALHVIADSRHLLRDTVLATK